MEAQHSWTPPPLVRALLSTALGRLAPFAADLVAHYTMTLAEAGEHEAFLSGDWPQLRFALGYAVARGDLRLFLWAQAHRPFDDPEGRSIAWVLASGGSLGLVRWAFRSCLVDCELSEICGGAAAGGHVDILRWAKAVHSYGPNTGLRVTLDKGCPALPFRYSYKHVHPDAVLCYLAAEGRHVKAFEWLLSLDGDLGECVCAAMAAKEEIYLLRWAYAHGARLSRNCCTRAATNGNISMFRWIHEVGCPNAANCDTHFCLVSLATLVVEALAVQYADAQNATSSFTDGIAYFNRHRVALRNQTERMWWPSLLEWVQNQGIRVAKSADWLVEHDPVILPRTEAEWDVFETNLRGYFLRPRPVAADEESSESSGKPTYA